MKIIIETIPHKEQRYPTVGDWTYDPEKKNLSIKVSETSDWRYEALVAVHELVEILLCMQRGIAQDSVDEFDTEFEKVRAKNIAIIGEQEPGMMVSAPYHKEHMFATILERQLADQLGVDWDKYEKDLNNLS